MAMAAVAMGIGETFVGMTSAASGAMILKDNVPINAHAGETVLTAPLSSSLKQGLQRFGDNRGGAGAVRFGDINIHEAHSAEAVRQQMREELGPMIQTMMRRGALATT